MKIKNLISIFAVLMLLASTATAQTSGSCGENATWAFDTESQTLTISGTGAMADYNSSTMPWNDIKDNIHPLLSTKASQVLVKVPFMNVLTSTLLSFPMGLQQFLIMLSVLVQI